MSVATLKNATAQRYRTNFIEPGIVSYKSEGEGDLLVTKDALDRMLPTFIGMPVFNEIHKDIDSDLAFRFREASDDEKRDLADGIVADAMYNPETGWYDAVLLIWDEPTIRNIEQFGYSVSCAYDIEEVDNTGGSWHAMPYDAELISGKYVHMAVVPNPRYEGARIVKNSKGTQEDTVNIRIFKKAENADEKKSPKQAKNMDPPKEEEVMENMDGMVEMPDGSEVPLEELIAMYKEKMTEKENMGTRYSAEDMIEVDGESMSIGDMINACGYGKENAEMEPATQEAEPVVDEAKQKQNSADGKKHFETVKKAANAGDDMPAPKLNTRSARLEAGKTRYGKVVKGGTK